MIFFVIPTQDFCFKQIYMYTRLKKNNGIVLEFT